MLTQYTLKMPHAVYSGKDALDKLTQIIGTGVKKTAVFTDRGIIGAGLLELPLSKIKESGCEYVIFDDLAAEPTYEQAQKAVDAFKESGADFIVAVGGGSVIDTAKLASVLATDEYGVKELLDNPQMAKKCVKTLMIPPTASQALPTGYNYLFRLRVLRIKYLRSGLHWPLLPYLVLRPPRFLPRLPLYLRPPLPAPLSLPSGCCRHYILQVPIPL